MEKFLTWAKRVNYCRGAIRGRMSNSQLIYFQGWVNSLRQLRPSRFSSNAIHPITWHLNSITFARNQSRPTAYFYLFMQMTVRPASVEILLPSPMLESGKTQQIQCRTTGANPAAHVTWWAGNKQLESTETTVRTCHSN